MRRWTPLILLFALVPVACGGGGGGGDKKSAKDYAKNVCTATKDWIGSLQQGQGEITKRLGPNSSPQQGKEALQKFLGDAVTATDKFASGVKDAGFPDVKGGKDFSDSLQEGADKAKQAIADAKSKADSLPTDNTAAFTREAGELGTSTNKALTAVGSAIRAPSDKDFRKAFQDTAECKSVGSA